MRAVLVSFLTAVTMTAGCAAPLLEVPPAATDGESREDVLDDKLPALAIYRAKTNKTCTDPGKHPENCVEIPGFLDKYWRLVLKDVNGGIGTHKPGKPSALDFFSTAFKREDTLLTQSIYIARGSESIEIPVSITTFVNDRFQSEQLETRPAVLTPWTLGAKEAIEDVHFAALASVVSREKTNFVKLANGALKALALFYPASTAAFSVTSADQLITEFDELEGKLNEARSSNFTFSTQKIQIHPRYLSEINVYARQADGNILSGQLYKVAMDDLRDSLFLTLVSDKANLSIINGYELVASQPGQPRTRLIAAIKKSLPTLGENAQVSLDHCTNFFDEAGVMGLNRTDQALATASWLESLGWNRMMSRRDPAGACYAKLYPLLSESNKDLLVSAKQLERESDDRRLQDKALGEFTVIFTGENLALAEKRFLSTVRVETAEKNELLNDYFMADLEIEGATFTAGQLTELFKPSDLNPLKFLRRSPCYRPTSTDTSAITIETRCMFVVGDDGITQPYKVTLSLDRSIINEPEKAAIRTIRFNKLN